MLRKQVSQEELLRKDFKNGSQKAFNEVYSMFASAMYGICVRYMVEESLAEDVLQESFIKVYENRHLFDEKYPLASWIKQIVINTALNELKKKRPVLIGEEEIQELKDECVSIQDIENSVKDLDVEVILSLVTVMPEGYRTVFNLYVFDNLTHEEIGRYLGVSPNTSKSQLSRARKWLKKAMMELQKLDDE